MRNGRGIGFRNLPTISEASGVWDMEDAYLADRDGVWPRWPKDAGLPILPGLAVWLEVDYGLYQDRAATVPAVADGDPVNSWVNRGYAGAMRVSTAFAPMTLRISGAHRWVETTGAISDPLGVTFRRYTYIFGIGYDPSSNSNMSVARCDPASGIYTAEQPQLQVQHGGVALPKSSTSGQSLLRTISSNRIFGNGFVDFAYFSENVEHFGAVNSARVMRHIATGPYAISGGTTAVPEPQETPVALRLFGRDTTNGLYEGGMSKVKAVVMYFSDTPLSPAEMESVANALATKHDAFTYAAAKWGN